MSAGAAISLAAAAGWTAETVDPTAAVEIVRIGQPIPLARPPSSASADVTLPSLPATATPVRPFMGGFIRHYPHWTVEVMGR
jgi:hypothetical protein